MKPRVVACLALLTLTACVPEDGDGSTGGAGHVSCGSLRPSAPHTTTLAPDGPNFYQFGSRAEGEISCTARVAQIGVTVVFHHSTNGQTGAVTGRTSTCRDKSTCTSFTDYVRRRLFCREVYHYDDFAQVTGWYRVQAADAAKTIPSREGLSTRGASSYNPREAGCR